MDTKQGTPPARSASRIAAVLYLAAALLTVLSPVSDPLNRITVWLYVFFRYRLPIAPDAALPEHYGALLNVLLFVPAGFFLVVLFGWGRLRATLVCALASAGVELFQALLLAHRQPTLLDVATNTLGGLLGALLGHWWVSRSSRDSPDSTRPRRP